MIVSEANSFVTFVRATPDSHDESRWGDLPLQDCLRWTSERYRTRGSEGRTGPGQVDAALKVGDSEARRGAE
jgi:hypothetical protein